MGWLWGSFCDSIELVFPSLQNLAAGSLSVEAAQTALTGIRRTFRLRQRVLYQCMQSGKLSSRAPALRHLITRLNFNGSFAAGGAAA